MGRKKGGKKTEPSPPVGADDKLDDAGCCASIDPIIEWD